LQRVSRIRSFYCRRINSPENDSEFHGLYEMIGTDGKPTIQSKGRIRKAAYHDGRAILNITERLRKLAEKSAQ